MAERQTRRHSTLTSASAAAEAAAAAADCSRSLSLSLSLGFFFFGAGVCAGGGKLNREGSSSRQRRSETVTSGPSCPCKSDRLNSDTGELTAAKRNGRTCFNRGASSSESLSSPFSDDDAAPPPAAPAEAEEALSVSRLLPRSRDLWLHERRRRSEPQGPNAGTAANGRQGRIRNTMQETLAIAIQRIKLRPCGR